MRGLASAFFALRAWLRLSILADLFGVFFGSGREAWRHAWNLAGIEALGALPAVGWSRTRSCS